MAMLAGAPFPDFYNWTWGEINEFISCKNEARINDLKEQAYMDFKHAMLVCKILGSKRGAKFDVTKEYDFLWSEEERKNMEIERFKNQMLSMCKK